MQIVIGFGFQTIWMQDQAPQIVGPDLKSKLFANCTISLFWVTFHKSPV